MTIYNCYDKDEEYNEIIDKIQQGYGCILIDASCYLPLEENVKSTSICLDVGKTECEDIKLNHRYPNRKFVTASKITGKKVSKTGYPFFYKLSEHLNEYKNRFTTLFSMDIDVRTDKGGNSINLVVPISAQATQDKPISVMCACFFVFADRDCRYDIVTMSGKRDIITYSTERISEKDSVFMGTARRMDRTFLFSEPVKLYTMSKDEFDECLYSKAVK